MTDLTHLFKIGQRIKYKNNDFDSIKKFEDGIIKEVYADHIIVSLMDIDTDIWCEEDFNLDCVYPEYNFK